MKLWKKLAILTVLTLLLSCGISGAVYIERTAQYNERKTLESYGQQLQAASYSMGRELEEGLLASYSGATRNAFYNFIIKKYDASCYILICGDRVVCNLTEYELLDTDTDSWNGQEPEAKIQRMGENRILIMGKRIPENIQGNYRLLLVKDISEIYREMRQQALLFFGVYVLTAFLSIFIIFLVTKKMLMPLKELQEAAFDISEGKLERRVHICNIQNQNELISLTVSFNRMADRIEEQVRQLEEVSGQRKLLLGSLTHELKTPMTSIIGYSDTLLHVKLGEEKKQQALLHIYEECRRLERLSSKLMSLIGLYDNESIEMEGVDVSDLFDAVKELEEWQLKDRGMELLTSCGMGKITGDRDLLVSLLVNLVDNAIKAGKSGDVIRLEGKGTRITVQDQGRGIPEEEIAHVTEAFYMVDKSRSRKAGGTGLGLALCSSIASLHGAELSIESRTGEGTCVTITFCEDSLRPSMEGKAKKGI